MPAPILTLKLEEGHAWMRGPPCPHCRRGKDDLVTGVTVSLPAVSPHQYQCAYCGGEIDALTGYKTPQTGNVEIFPDANGIKRENPYLYPEWNPFGDHRLDPTAPDGEPDKVWFDYGLNDIGNAQRLVMLHGAWIHHVHEWGWLIYDGRRWSLDKEGGMRRFAKHTVKSMIAAAGNDGRIDPQTDFGKQWLAHAQKSAAKARMEAMIELAASEPGVPASVDDFDADSDSLNVANGVIHLPTGQLREHSAEDMSTHLVDVSYDPLAECPRWDQFLEEITLGDTELIEYLQTAIGYSLTGSTREQKLFFLFGDGANGKSTLLEVIRELMGDYSTTLPFEAFLATRNKDVGRHLAGLPGRRYVTAVEAGEGRSFDEEMIKSVTGGDTVMGRHLYREAFEFKPSAKIWLAANDKPSIRGVNEGIWRRFHIIPLQADLPEEEQDPYLRDKLLEELPGILAWAVRGAKRWFLNGLPMPDLVSDALKEYRSEQDVIGRFVEDCCIVDKSEVTTAASLQEAYTVWAKKTGETKLTAMQFGRRLGRYRAGLFRPTKSFGSRAWEGITLKPNLQNPDDEEAKSVLDWMNSR